MDSPAKPLLQRWRMARPWKRREPLPDQWRATPAEEREDALEYWLALAASDAWTFEQLVTLFGECRRAGDVPPVLREWAFDKAEKGLSAPKRSGPKHDSAEDYRIIAEVCVRMILFDEKPTPTCRAVAAEHNVDHWIIRDAYNRARKWPDDPTL